MLRALPTLLLCACAGDALPADSAPSTVPWSASLPRLQDELPALRGWASARAVVHLHSPYSHDACDGAGLVDGQLDAACLEDLRVALCDTAFDVAFATDHPAFAAAQAFPDLLLGGEGDTLVDAAGAEVDRASAIGNRIACADGTTTLWLPGIEDERMPVALDRHAGADADESDRIYNDPATASLQAELDAGATALVAHTEGRAIEDLRGLVDAGLVGIEAFNLHAMFDPDIRADDLGLDGLGWVTEIAPFTSQDGSAEPDLLLLGLLEHQDPSLAAWDALNADPPDGGARLVVGVAGTDAHQNALPFLLRDGERGDSYRRMLRWFSNHLRVPAGGEALSPAVAESALRAGRSIVAFELLGTPDGVDFWLEGADGLSYEMGQVGPAGTLHVGCPRLSPGSPRGEEEPALRVTLLRDGVAWAEGCGAHTVEGTATWRVQVDLLPWHLADYLGEDASPWMREYPWVYTNPIRVLDP